MAKNKFFNELSPAELERLAFLSEELGETQQAIGKIIRHGYARSNPLDNEAINNRGALEKEIGDVLAGIKAMVDAGDISDEVHVLAEIKGDSMKRWMHHQS